MSEWLLQSENRREVSSIDLCECGMQTGSQLGRPLGMYRGRFNSQIRGIRFQQFHRHTCLRCFNLHFFSFRCPGAQQQIAILLSSLK